MSLFNTFKKSKVCKIDTVVGQNAKINGSVTGEGNYKIDGVIIGDINVSGDVIVTEGASINGKISAVNVLIAGTVNGGIIAKGLLAIQSTAKVCGKHQCAELTAEKGSTFKSFCFITGQPQPDTDRLVADAIDDIAI